MILLHRCILILCVLFPLCSCKSAKSPTGGSKPSPRSSPNKSPSQPNLPSLNYPSPGYTAPVQVPPFYIALRFRQTIDGVTATAFNNDDNAKTAFQKTAVSLINLNSTQHLLSSDDLSINNVTQVLKRKFLSVDAGAISINLLEYFTTVVVDLTASTNDSIIIDYTFKEIYNSTTPFSKAISMANALGTAYVSRITSGKFTGVMRLNSISLKSSTLSSASSVVVSMDGPVLLGMAPTLSPAAIPTYAPVEYPTYAPTVPLYSRDQKIAMAAVSCFLGAVMIGAIFYCLRKYYCNKGKDIVSVPSNVAVKEGVVKSSLYDVYSHKNDTDSREMTENQLKNVKDRRTSRADGGDFPVSRSRDSNRYNQPNIQRGYPQNTQSDLYEQPNIQQGYMQQAQALPSQYGDQNYNVSEYDQRGNGGSVDDFYLSAHDGSNERNYDANAADDCLYWKEFRHKSGKPYWYNIKTKESSWKKPVD